MDVKFLLRVPHDVLKKRRGERTYSIEDGQDWNDPPLYWDRVVYPAYAEAHSELFEGGDVENGQVKVKQAIHLLECPDGQVDDTVEQCCNVLIYAMDHGLFENTNLNALEFT